ncbi:unnamed protein product, partial [Phaeothamnion confervicola]
IYNVPVTKVRTENVLGKRGHVVGKHSKVLRFKRPDFKRATVVID